ncbi:MAG: HlyD family efflux transporter periplasmic adaptor subunit [Planctomycetaceae bacterium]|nr:HlyD family efflux transporter periplasmic adaptor subunit [Planctomycetaceae bacterium]
MSEPNRPESGGVESARQQILALVREIEMLADSKAAPELFYPEYLKRVVMALGADAAAVWLYDEQQQFGLAHFVQRTPLGIFENPQALSAYQKLLSEALQSGGVRVYRPGDSRAGELPTPHVQIIGALQDGTDPLGVLQILQRSEAPDEARAGYLQFVEQMCSFVARYIRGCRQPAASAELGRESQDLRRIVLELHSSLSVAEVASIAASDGATFLGCDRVSVVERYGTKTLVRAVSGQDGVNLRSNLIRLMSQLAEKVLATGERLQYSGKAEGLPPQIEEPLAEFLDISRSRLLTVVPLFPREPTPGSRPPEAGADPRRKAAAKAPLGALIVEQVTDGRLRADFETRLEVLAEQTSQALVNAQEHEQIPLLRVWKFVGRQTSLLKGRRLAQFLVGFGALAAVVGAMAFVPWDYRVEGKGRLMPVVRQNVFAPSDGKVIEILVESGQHVDQGALLLKLQNDEQHARLLATSTEYLEKQKQLVALRQEMAETARNLSPDEQTRLQGKITQTRLEAEGAKRRLELLAELEKKLEIHSPISGVIATFQVAQLLTNRPVRRGETLLEVMDEKGSWRLELEVPEQRLGHILIGQEQLATPNLPVEFVLATATESTFPARLETSATRSVTSEQGGTVVEVFASLDEGLLPHRRIGAEVTAKINCGKRSLGYVLFGDVIEFLRKRLWI